MAVGRSSFVVGRLRLVGRRWSLAIGSIWLVVVDSLNVLGLIVRASFVRGILLGISLANLLGWILEIVMSCLGYVGRSC